MTPEKRPVGHQSPTRPTLTTSYSDKAVYAASLGLQSRALIHIEDRTASLRSVVLMSMPYESEKVLDQAFAFIAEFLPAGALDSPLSDFDAADLVCRLDTAAQTANQIMERSHAKA